MKKQSKRKSAPKKLQAIQTSRHFRVVHHQHTGHVVPHRGTSYPLLAMIVLCVGVFLTGWTQMVGAWPDSYPDPISNSYDVHVRVPGPAPTQAATIDSPSNNTTFTTVKEVPITVSGSCPVNTYVELLRNNVASGVALCQAAGTYSLSTDLFEGKNELVARVHNFTDVPGPDSSITVVYYKPAQAELPSTSGGGQTTSSSSSSSSSSSTSASSGSSAAMSTTAPFLLKPSFVYQGYYVNEYARWQVEIAGGTAPYALAVDWGDGQHDLYSRAESGNVILQHKYQQAGGYKGSYVIQISASDNQGRHGSLQLLAIINNPPTTVAASHAGSSGGLTKGIGILSSGALGKLMKYVWPGYGIVVLMLASFWLGERRELQLLKFHKHRTRHA